LSGKKQQEVSNAGGKIFTPGDYLRFVKYQLISAGRKHRDTHFIQRSVAETICATVNCHYGVKPRI